MNISVVPMSFTLPCVWPGQAIIELNPSVFSEQSNEIRLGRIIKKSRPIIVNEFGPLQPSLTAPIDARQHLEKKGGGPGRRNGGEVRREPR